MLKVFDLFIEYLKRLSSPTMATVLPLVLLHYFELVNSGDVELFISTMLNSFNELFSPLVELLLVLELEVKKWQMFLLLYISYCSFLKFISNHICRFFNYEPYYFSIDGYAASSKERSALIIYAETSQERNHGNMFSGFNNKIYEVVGSLRKSDNFNIEKQERSYIFWNNFCAQYFFAMLAVFTLLVFGILPAHDNSNTWALILSLLIMLLIFQFVNDLSKEEYAYIMIWVALNKLSNESDKFKRDNKAVERDLEYYYRGESIPGLPYGYFSILHYIRQIPLFGKIGRFPWKPSGAVLNRGDWELVDRSEYNWIPVTCFQKLRTRFVFALVELGWIKIDGPILGTVCEKERYIK